MKKITATLAIFVSLLCQTFIMPAQPAGAIDFDGSNDHMYVGDNPALDFSTAFSFESWVYVKSYSYATLVAKFEDDNDNRGWMVNIGELGGNTLVVILDNAGDWLTNHIQWNSGFVPNLNTWYHIAVTFDGTLASNNIKLFVNGSLYSQGTWTHTIYNNAARAYFGGYDGPGNGLNAGANGRYLNGKMDEIRLWNRALCAAEIVNNMNVELVGSQNGLVTYFQNNQGIAGGSNSTFTTSPDASGSALNATLTNLALIGNVSNWVTGTVAIGSSTPAYSPVSASVLSPTNVSCFGGNNGAITVTLTSGTATSYSWAPSGGTLSSTSGLSAGTYSCYVGHACGTMTLTANVTQPPAISNSTAVSNAPCYGGSGSATITSSGGTGAYTYSWSGGATTSVAALPAGAHTATVTDANLCTTVSSVNITQPAAVQVTVSASAGTICSGESVTLTAGGANTYTWSSGQNSVSIVTTPGSSVSYTATGANSSGCTGTANISLTVDACVGLNEISNSTSEMIVYPNPSAGNFNIEIAVDSDLIVLDAFGRLIHKSFLTKGVHEVNLQQRDPGMYFLKTGTKLVKVIKQ